VISHATNFEGKDQSQKFYETKTTFEKKELIKREREGGGEERGVGEREGEISLSQAQFISRLRDS